MNLLVVAYLAVIVAANLLVAHFGASAVLFNAFFLIAFDLSCRDRLHDLWEHRHLALKMAALIFSGSLLSALLSIDALPIAVASFVAFGVSELADTLVYAALHRQTKARRMFLSNCVSAFVDSAVFITLAFGLPPLWTVIFGQYIAKVAGGALWTWILLRVRVRQSEAAR